MRAVDILTKKRDGERLSRGEIDYLINGYVDGSIPEYQISAWLMAVFFKGMSGEESGALTQAMIDSGDTLNLSSLPGPLVDKHSTGGVGDKVSLILAPIAAACGVQVPMMSGRALGHTGGTLDKLESISGYSTALDNKTFCRIIDSCGFAMTGQSERIVPADRLLYALRDVTATVESIPLITASIMSKKFAEGAESLVFDVKSGAGAFMKTVEDARRLADSLIATGKSLGRGVAAVITHMDEPLGYMVGNFLEVEESLLCLRNETSSPSYPHDLMEVTLRLSSWMLVAAGVAENIDAATERCRAVLADGSAHERFMKNVELQGGDPERLNAELGSRRSSRTAEICADRAGVVAEIDAYEVGMAGVTLGVGRNKTDDKVLANVGIELSAKVGDAVGVGDPLFRIHGESEDAVESAGKRVRAAYTISDSASRHESLIIEELSAL
jgi:pyrimidine-nucleoside phosphorylase